MGEAKRRKLNDPNYGKNNVKITITESPNTGNFLIVFNKDFIYDSALKFKDALKVKENAKQLFIQFPLKHNETFSQWTERTLPHAIQVDSEITMIKIVDNKAIFVDCKMSEALEMQQKINENQEKIIKLTKDKLEDNND